MGRLVFQGEIKKGRFPSQMVTWEQLVWSCDIYWCYFCNDHTLVTGRSLVKSFALVWSLAFFQGTSKFAPISLHSEQTSKITWVCIQPLWTRVPVEAYSKPKDSVLRLPTSLLWEKIIMLLPYLFCLESLKNESIAHFCKVTEIGNKIKTTRVKLIVFL